MAKENSIAAVADAVNSQICDLHNVRAIIDSLRAVGDQFEQENGDDVVLRVSHVARVTLLAAIDELHNAVEILRAVDAANSKEVAHV